MKKVIFGTALASMALLSACSSDNELANVETAANNAIGFHVVGNKAETRATPITPDNLTTTDFNVFAYKNNNGADGDIFMGDNGHDHGLKGVTIKYKNNKWDYDNPADLHYWPKDGTLNFYAVSPASIPAGVTLYSWDIQKETKTITYSCFDEYNRTDGKANPDVMYAFAKNKTQGAAGKVSLNFQHILSQVVFQAKTVNSDMEVDIKDIKIKNFKLGGTFTIPTDGSSPSQSSWNLGEVYKLTAFTVIKKSDADPIKIIGTEATDISSGTPMLFVPQLLTQWDVAHKITDADTNGESYLIINCKIKQKNDYLHGTADKYEALYVPFGTSWDPGKRYIYTLIFGGGYDDQGQQILMPINFEATTTNWVNDINNNDINIDK